ncbi:hypothetical protein [Amycolatopsis sp. cmx-4-61]|uniref:hypothetical protein n=1 Tax=Amycolatopsis sp. cmx-4-61 TaxID=2790937 RepID=UPI00397A7055
MARWVDDLCERTLAGVDLVHEAVAGRDEQVARYQYEPEAPVEFKKLVHPNQDGRRIIRVGGAPSTWP